VAGDELGNGVFSTDGARGTTGIIYKQELGRMAENEINSKKRTIGKKIRKN
jgi:hypothetical protein